jgi:hypothetical protein
MTDLRDSAEYFARKLLLPNALLIAFRKRKGRRDDVPRTFQVPAGVALAGWDESSALAN